MQIGHNVYQHKYVHQHYHLVLLENSRYPGIYRTIKELNFLQPDSKYYSCLAENRKGCLTTYYTT